MKASWKKFVLKMDRRLFQGFFQKMMMMRLRLSFILVSSVAHGLHVQPLCTSRPFRLSPFVAMGTTSELDEVLKLIKSDKHDQITLQQSLEAIESQYDFTPVPFSVGSVRSSSGENTRTAKILCVPVLI